MHQLLNTKPYSVSQGLYTGIGEVSRRPAPHRWVLTGWLCCWWELFLLNIFVLWACLVSEDSYSIVGFRPPQGPQSGDIKGCHQLIKRMYRKISAYRGSLHLFRWPSIEIIFFNLKLQLDSHPMRQHTLALFIIGFILIKQRVIMWVFTFNA